MNFVVMTGHGPVRFCLSAIAKRVIGAAALVACWIAPAVGHADNGLNSYPIAIGDSLQLDFLDDESNPYPLVVGGDGAVQLPFLGTLSIAGRTLSEAHGLINTAYVDGEIFLAPRTDLSVLRLRPFSVLGDVKETGFFDYRAELTAEQAIGLAGGIARDPGGEEERQVQRVVLRGELASVENAIIREAVAAERLKMQLEGRDRIDPRQIRPRGIDRPDPELIRQLIAQDEAIISAEKEHFSAERLLLIQVLDELKEQISLIEDQILAQKAQIASYEEELANSDALMERGLIAAPVRNRLLREVADEETVLLQMQTGLISARQELVRSERELLTLNFDRLQKWRLERADVGVKEAQLRETHTSLMERLALLADWSLHAARGDSSTRVNLVIRRQQPDGGTRTIEAQETDLILPGDVLIVRAVTDNAPGRAALDAPAQQSDERNSG